MLLASASSEMVNSVTLAGHWSLVSKPFGASFIDNTLWLVIPGDTDSAISNGIHRWQLPPPSATTSCASWGSQTQTLMTRRPNEPRCQCQPKPCCFSRTNQIRPPICYHPPPCHHPHPHHHDNCFHARFPTQPVQRGDLQRRGRRVRRLYNQRTVEVC